MHITLLQMQLQNSTVIMVMYLLQKITLLEKIYLQKYLKIPANRIEVIYHGFDVEEGLQEDFSFEEQKFE